MPESYTPREIINNINSNNPSGAKIDLYGSAQLGKFIQNKNLAEGNIFATTEQEITKEQQVQEEQRKLELEKSKEEKIAEAEQDLQKLHDYLEGHGIEKHRIMARLGKLEVYFDENTESAIIAHADKRPFVLDLSYLELTGELPIPKQMLMDTLNFMKNKITSLPELPACLITLWCGKNRLTRLPELPKGLEELYCAHNSLTKLPELPSTLEQLLCFDNKLTSLPDLPSRLEDLQCNVNMLTSLPELPASLKQLYCAENQFTDSALREILEQKNKIGFSFVI